MIIFLSRKRAVAQMFEDDEKTLSVQDLEQVIAKLKRKTYHGRQSKYEALWRTLIADTADFKPASPQFQQHFDAIVDSLRLRARGVFWDRSRVHEETKMDLVSQLRLLNDVEAEHLCQRIDEQDSRPYFRELVNTIEGRVFFATVKGFIGIGSPGAEPGDQIAILKGGWSPFILREHGMYFEMQGDAYVHGLKDAELLASVRARTQSLEIR